MSKSLLIFYLLCIIPAISISLYRPEGFLGPRMTESKLQSAGLPSDSYADEVWTSALSAEGTECCLSLHFNHVFVFLRFAPWEYAITTALLEKKQHGLRIRTELSVKHNVILWPNFSNNTNPKATVFIW